MRFSLFLLIFMNNLSGLIHVIGDANSFYSFTPISDSPRQYNHTLLKQLYYPFFTFHWFGDCTLYNIDTHINTFFNNKLCTGNLRENDICIFSFGSIDCRSYIEKYVTDDVTKENLIDDLVLKYQQALMKFKQKFSNLNLKIIILGVLPPLHTYHPSLSVYGNFKERLESVLLLNERLKMMAIAQGYDFLNQYILFCDGDGSMFIDQCDKWNCLDVKYNYKVWDQLLRMIPY